MTSLHTCMLMCIVGPLVVSVAGVCELCNARSSRWALIWTGRVNIILKAFDDLYLVG